MVKFYVNRIREGKLTLDQVPSRWHDAVKDALENPDNPDYPEDIEEMIQKSEAFDYLTGRGEENE